MANNTFLVEERSRDIGKFLVGRLLPFREKRTVGPFCFIDHMGPAVLGNGKNADVDQHPHIGLCTLTYLMSGEMMHRDSTGAVQKITPGSVNLMVSGSGVTHTERSPEELRDGAEYLMHGYQVWIALPKEKEEAEPAFFHVAGEDLPRWSHNGLECTLVAGQGFGRTSPVPAFSPLFMVDIKAEKTAELCIDGQLEGEIAVVVVNGSVSDMEHTVEQGQMLISKTENICSIRLEAGTQVLLFGGKAFPEERFMYWNFVSHSKERLEKAKDDWKNHRFPTVPGDDTYIPLPS